MQSPDVLTRRIALKEAIRNTVKEQPGALDRRRLQDITIVSSTMNRPEADTSTTPYCAGTSKVVECVVTSQGGKAGDSLAVDIRGFIPKKAKDTASLPSIELTSLKSGARADIVDFAEVASHMGVSCPQNCPKASNIDINPVDGNGKLH